MSDELKPLSKKHQAVQDKYLTCFNQTQAYLHVYTNVTYDSARTASARLFADDNFLAHLKLRLDEAHMSADEALALQAEIARANIGVFFKMIDEWVFDPLPSYEIIGQQEVVDDSDKDNPVKRISYRVRHVALDMDKVIDPRYSHLIHKFSDSRKTGLSIETYDKQTAIRDALKVHGKFTDKVQVEHSGGIAIIEKKVGVDMSKV